jgi:hypothetical protein
MEHHLGGKRTPLKMIPLLHDNGSTVPTSLPLIGVPVKAANPEKKKPTPILMLQFAHNNEKKFRNGLEVNWTCNTTYPISDTSLESAAKVGGDKLRSKGLEDESDDDKDDD